MANPDVSIIIPCYNAASYIAQAIHSALDQTYPDCEVIVIDDGSTDKSLDVIKSFGERIRWETGPNRGGCEARNRGIELAKGEWIQFLDADDVLLDTCVYDKLKEPNTERELVCCDVEVFPCPKKRHPYWHLTRYDLATMLQKGSPQTAAPLHKRDTLLQLGGFREGLKCAQEFDLHLRLAIELGIEFRSISKVGVRVRATPGSVSRGAGVNMPLMVIDVLSHAESLLKEKGQLHGDLQDTIAMRLTFCAALLWRLQERDRSMQALEHARRLSPRWYRGYSTNSMLNCVAGLFGFETSESLRETFRTCYRSLHDAIRGSG